jgi:hypothetical protein
VTFCAIPAEYWDGSLLDLLDIESYGMRIGMKNRLLLRGGIGTEDDETGVPVNVASVL